MTMKFIGVICVLMACAFGLVTADSAVAAEITTFTAATNNLWSETTNWDNGIPELGDTAIIDTGKTCNLDVTTADLDKVEVKSTANLNVKAGGTLRLTTTTESVISGTMTLESSTSLIEITLGLTISGSGKIVGTNDNAEIAVSDGKTFINATTIEGKLKITGDGSVETVPTQFRNSGTVHANVAGTLWVNTRDVDDTSTGVWKSSTNASAVLRFDPAISGSVGARQLEGDFDLVTGTFDVDHPGFDTTGTFTWTGGTVDCSTSGGQARFTGS